MLQTTIELQIEEIADNPSGIINRNCYFADCQDSRIQPINPYSSVG